MTNIGMLPSNGPKRSPFVMPAVGSRLLSRNCLAAKDATKSRSAGRVQTTALRQDAQRGRLATLQKEMVAVSMDAPTTMLRPTIDVPDVRRVFENANERRVRWFVFRKSARSSQVPGPVRAHVFLKVFRCCCSRRFRDGFRHFGAGLVIGSSSAVGVVRSTPVAER